MLISILYSHLNLSSSNGSHRSCYLFVQAKAAVEQEKANKAAADADLIQTQASQELAAAEPLLAAAVAALDCLTKASLTELKAFQRLPTGVDQVLIRSN